MPILESSWLPAGPHARFETIRREPLDPAGIQRVPRRSANPVNGYRVVNTMTFNVRWNAEFANEEVDSLHVEAFYHPIVDID